MAQFDVYRHPVTEPQDEQPYVMQLQSSFINSPEACIVIPIARIKAGTKPMALAKFVAGLDMLKSYRVLDPACCIGNFLFLGPKALKDIEHKSHLVAAAMGLDMEADLVTGPHNMSGIELNEYAAELARVTVWIGELQWRLSHGYEFKTNPVLVPLDNIECRDALISFVDGDGDGDSSHTRRATRDEVRAGQTNAAHTLRFLKLPQMPAPRAPLESVGKH